MSSELSPFAGPGPTRIFEDALAAGKFIIQQCKECGQHLFYPRALCPHCGAVDLKWVEPTGRGVVYSTSVVRLRPEHGPDYNVVLVDLEEGPRMMGRVVDIAPDKVKIGMRVSAKVSMIDGEPAVVFITKEQGAQEW